MWQFRELLPLKIAQALVGTTVGWSKVRVISENTVAPEYILQQLHGATATKRKDAITNSPTDRTKYR